METFSALLAIRAGNSPVTGEFPAQRPVTQSFDAIYSPVPYYSSVNNVTKKVMGMINNTNQNDTVKQGPCS